MIAIHHWHYSKLPIVINNRTLYNSAMWRNRIIDTSSADPLELARGYNPNNWRHHPQIQREALEDVLDSIGVLQPVLFNRLSGKVIDGHLRIELAILKGQPLIPVNYVELTDDEEALALATLDAITEQAEPIPDKLAALLERTRAMTADRPGLGAMLEALKAGIYGPDTPMKTMRAREQGYVSSSREIEPIKLAHRIEAAWQADGNLAIDLFSGDGGLAFWYRRRFERVITVDKSAGGVDYPVSAAQFIKVHLPEHVNRFDFIDFDDEGSPAREINLFFDAISGQRDRPFILALTDGCGLNLKIQGRFDFSLYGHSDGVRKAKAEDYARFEDTVAEFIEWKAKEANFTPTMLSNYRGREGNVVYQTWLMTPGPLVFS